MSASSRRRRRAFAARGPISINGAAAHRVVVGDTVIIGAIARKREREMRGFRPNLIFVHEAIDLT
ncbi:aspartate 1-decarboxylase [Bradyrhizobium sp. UFLA06-06]